MNITERLFELRDSKYAEFQFGLMPGAPLSYFIGVRIPALRDLAKEIAKDPSGEEFLRDLPHRYNDENLLQSILISGCRDFDKCLADVEAFLPYVDNWAVCDTLSPKVFKKHRSEIMKKIPEWTRSDHVYTCRFGIGMLMSLFLDEDFTPEYLDIPASIVSEEYYISMMIAWYFATALAKQWDATIPYIENRRLTPWVHRKTIQKAIESYRITPEQKEYLRTLR